MLGSAEFQRQFLRRHLWEKEVEICDCIDTYRTVAVKGCHGSGKTYTVAGIVPYELTAHEESLVLVVAPTLRQVLNFWGEVHTVAAALPFPQPEPLSQRWQFSPKCFAQGFSSARGVNAQGFHGNRVLIIADEAIGISGDLWDAIEGIRSSGDVRLVTMCNPTAPNGPVYDSFTRGRGVPGHCCITISAFDTPNLQGLTMESLLQLSEADLDYAPFPQLTRRRWVKEMYFKWGPQNPRFLSRVLGEFPTQADDAVFQLAWIERAGLPNDPAMLGRQRIGRYYIQVGIDVAGPGDDETVAYARLGPYVLDMAAWPDPDPRNKCMAWLDKLARQYPDAEIILMGDTVGIGYYFMRHLAARYRVLSFVAGQAPVDAVKFVNKKAEAYFTLRDWMQEDRIRGILDEDTKAQLSDVRYREKNGRIEIEHKDEARERGTHSPDRAEALIMAFQRIHPQVLTVQYGGPVEGLMQISPI